MGCQGSAEHAPITGNSYLETYGIGNIWTGWLISRAPELAAETPEVLLRPEKPRFCPVCPGSQLMARRPGGWKCYRHEPPVVILEEARIPRVLEMDALRTVA